MTDSDRHVLSCPRCGGDHAGLGGQARPFANGAHAGIYSHWATCPATGDPILFFDRTIRLKRRFVMARLADFVMARLRAEERDAGREPRDEVVPRPAAGLPIKSEYVDHMVQGSIDRGDPGYITAAFREEEAKIYDTLVNPPFVREAQDKLYAGMAAPPADHTPEPITPAMEALVEAEIAATPVDAYCPGLGAVPGLEEWMREEFAKIPRCDGPRAAAGPSFGHVTTKIFHNPVGEPFERQIPCFNHVEATTGNGIVALGHVERTRPDGGIDAMVAYVKDGTRITRMIEVPAAQGLAILDGEFNKESERWWT